MSDTTKPQWKSKTFWAAVGLADVGMYSILQDQQYAMGAAFITSALGYWGIRTANKTIE